MAIVEAKILGTSYGLACDNGQESKLQNLVQKLNSRLKKISAANPKANEIKLLVLASLMLEDEMEDAKVAGKDQYNNDSQLIELIDSVSVYIENMTSKISDL